MKNKLIENIFFNYVYEILVIIIPIITAPYISRVLSPSGVGNYSYVLSLCTYFTTFAILGFHGYGLREIAFNRDNKEKNSQLFLELECLLLITTVAFSAGWGFLCFFYKKYTLLALCFFPNLLSVALDVSWFYKGIEKFRFVVVVNTIIKVLSVIFIFAFVKNQSHLYIYILIISLGTFFGSALMWIFVPKHVVRVKINPKNFGIHIKQSFVYFLPSIALLTYSVLDKTLIGLITNDSSQNGFYEQAHKIISIVLTLSCGAANGVFNSRFSYLYGKGKDISSIVNKNRDVINISLFLSVGAMFGLLAISKSFVPLFFGEEYAVGTSTILMIFAPVPVFAAFSNCLSSNYYTPCGKRKESAIIYCISAAINLSFNLLFIPKLGAIGASISTIISELTVAIILSWRSKGLVTLEIAFKLLNKKIIAGLLMFIYLFLINSTLQLNIYSLILEVFSGAIVYFVALVLLKDDSIVFVKKYLKI